MTIDACGKTKVNDAPHKLPSVTTSQTVTIMPSPTSDHCASHTTASAPPNKVTLRIQQPVAGAHPNPTPATPSNYYL